MDVEVVKTMPEPALNLDETEKPPYDDQYETETVNIKEKYLDFVEELRSEGYRVQKIVMHHRLFQLLCESFGFYRDKEHTADGKTMYYGIEIEPENLGRESITDFIIYTDRKTLHSDMVDKDFVEDLDVEQLLQKTNEKIDSR